jgi:hypothetical protein
MTYYVYDVKAYGLKKFLDKLQTSDELGGNTVHSIDKLGETYRIIATREASYPWITNQLEKLARELF